MEVSGTSVQSSLQASLSASTPKALQAAYSDDAVVRVQQVLERLETKRIVDGSLKIKQNIEDLREAFRPAVASMATTVASATSSAAVNLDVSATATVLRSTEAINTETT